jgi:hypothetical protein
MIMIDTVVQKITHEVSEAVLVLYEHISQLSSDPADIEITYSVRLRLPCLESFEPTIITSLDLGEITLRLEDIASEIYADFS